MTLTAKCDGCKKVLPGDQIITDYDGIDYCPRCSLTHKIADMKDEVKKTREWLEECYLAPIRKKEEEIAALEARLAAIHSRG